MRLDRPFVSRTLAVLLAVPLAAALMAGPASAQGRGRGNKGRDDHDRDRGRDAHVVAHLPPGHARVMVGSNAYFFNGGLFYREVPHGYSVVRAPRGAVVTALPRGFANVFLGPRHFAFYLGVFYEWRPDHRNYVVVDAPYGAEIRVLPRGYTTRQVRGEVYYVYDDVYYRPVRRNGVTMYVVTRVTF